MRRLCERGPYVPHFLDQLGSYVAGHVVVHEVLCFRRCLGRDHDRQRLVVDLDQVGRVLGDVAVFGDHERDGLADVAHYRRREASLRAAVGEVGMRDEDGEVGLTER